MADFVWVGAEDEGREGVEEVDILVGEGRWG